jgi:formate/nitrite transporter FocA (FNT family)
MPKSKKQEIEALPAISPAITKKIEEKQVQERVAIGAHVVHETIRREGEEELKRSSSALAWSGFAAGLSMGFSLVAEALLAVHLPQAAWTPLLTKFGYSVGFLIVVLGQHQLFTETKLTAVLPVLALRRMEAVLHMLRLWAWCWWRIWRDISFRAVHCEDSDLLWRDDAGARSRERRFSGCGVLGGGDAGDFCGWLIALMVWLLPGAESARVSIIIILTYLIGLGGFNHVIAGSTKMFFLVATGEGSWSYYLGRFLVPTLLGNIIGGVSLVAFPGHAQVVAGKEAK